MSGCPLSAPRAEAASSERRPQSGPALAPGASSLAGGRLFRVGIAHPGLCCPHSSLSRESLGAPGLGIDSQTAVFTAQLGLPVLP